VINKREREKRERAEHKACRRPEPIEFEQPPVTRGGIKYAT
jgi:hypothetical protein